MSARTKGRGDCVAAETIFTIGHSTRPIETFVRMLQMNRVTSLVDVRTIAESRHNPQFNGLHLSASLATEQIVYRRLESLGGRRHPHRNSINGAWKNSSFRGYADYMQTTAFGVGIEELAELGTKDTTVIMCAEAVPWRCHRSMIGDALVVRGIGVRDIISDRSVTPHTLTRFACVEGTRVTYPGDGSAAGC